MPGRWPSAALAEVGMEPPAGAAQLASSVAGEGCRWQIRGKREGGERGGWYYGCQEGGRQRQMGGRRQGRLLEFRPLG